VFQQALSDKRVIKKPRLCGFFVSIVYEPKAHKCRFVDNLVHKS